jgi:hypothetical protein
MEVEREGEPMIVKDLLEIEIVRDYVVKQKEKGEEIELLRKEKEDLEREKGEAIELLRQEKGEVRKRRRKKRRGRRRNLNFPRRTVDCDVGVLRQRSRWLFPCFRFPDQRYEFALEGSSPSCLLPLFSLPNLCAASLLLYPPSSFLFLPSPLSPFSLSSSLPFSFSLPSLLPSTLPPFPPSLLLFLLNPN